MNFVRINDYPNYVIHPCGTILKIWKNHTRQLYEKKESNGYMRTGLSKNGIQKHFSIHRLLGLHFIPNPENKPTIDHINRIKDDNRLENLRWATRSEQEYYKSFIPYIITKGNIRKRKGRNSWIWQYRMKGKGKSKSMKNREDLEKYREETIKNIMLLYNTLNEIG